MCACIFLHAAWQEISELQFEIACRDNTLADVQQVWVQRFERYGHLLVDLRENQVLIYGVLLHFATCLWNKGFIIIILFLLHLIYMTFSSQFFIPIYRYSNNTVFTSFQIYACGFITFRYILYNCFMVLLMCIKRFF